MSMNLDVMDIIQREKEREIIEKGNPALDDEIADVAEEKRKTFDLPTNAVKVDPLR